MSGVAIATTDFSIEEVSTPLHIDVTSSSTVGIFKSSIAKRRGGIRRRG